MGVEIPIVTMKQEEIHPQYGFYRTNSALDEVYKNFDKVKKLTVALTEVENAIYRLASHIKKTQKRANSLKNIIIPKYEEVTSTIQNALEEKEREEFTRLKMIKKAT
jgi:V/A-type H+-transporting ATPase subunit D